MAESKGQMEKLTGGRELANNIKWQQRHCIKMRVGIVAYGLSFIATIFVWICNHIFIMLSHTFGFCEND